ncbi:flagellar hook-basal body complex protein [Roseovarius salis]|uniref:flagellar hook-basal body complex protein n=1 Tax=Roseovarius salis TaxID=3376063 RepID=UPI0037C6F9E3
MEAAGYTTLTRQNGLLREIQIIANNIANASTTGFRAEGLIFSEHVVRTEGGPSLSMATGNVRRTSLAQGALDPTGGRLDFAIEGDGFFWIDTPRGERLTRAGNFTTNNVGELVTHDGHRVLDVGGAPVFIPPSAVRLGVASDGTLSADDQPLAQLGTVRPADGATLTREGGVLFRTDGALEPAQDARIVHRHLESANVDPVLQVARMVEVQRAYELGQSFLDAENERVREALRSVTRG